VTSLRASQFSARQAKLCLATGGTAQLDRGFELGEGLFRKRPFTGPCGDPGKVGQQDPAALAIGPSRSLQAALQGIYGGGELAPCFLQQRPTGERVPPEFVRLAKRFFRAINVASQQANLAQHTAGVTFCIAGTFGEQFASAVNFRFGGPQIALAT
jgi:hypothetical protein